MKKLKVSTPKWVAWLMLPIKKSWTDFQLRSRLATERKNKRFIYKYEHRRRSSYNTDRLLQEYQSKQYSFANKTLPFAGTVMFFLLFFQIRWKALLIITIVELFIFWINYLMVRKDLRRNSLSVYRKDRYDLFLSQKLKNVLSNFKTGSFIDYETDTMPLAGTWKPFRVDRIISSDVSAEFSGKMKSNGGFLFGASRGTLEGDFKALAVPKLLDSSTMIILVDKQEKTLRVLIPSPNAVVEFVKQVVENLSKDCSTRGSRVYDVLKSFSVTIFPLAHPELIDGIDFSCQKSLGKRPEILVHGHLIEPGVVFASSLEVNGVKSLFYPSGFLKALMEGIKPYTKGIPSAEKLRMLS